jgi:uncharacterized protein
MIKREAEKELRNLARQFKAVAIVGPRQSGKTTLAKYVFMEKPYVNLENPDTRQFALDDPRGFLDQYPDGALLDEAQRVPGLFSYLQQKLDDDSRPGKFVITGSNNFLLQENITQSLAGRVAYLYLLPFSISELQLEESNDASEFIFRGGYPPIYDQPVDAQKWYSNYTRTYVERDVRQIKNLINLITFERFMKLCAGRTGQLLNMNSLAIETGVDHKTIQSWLGVLESSFILFRLQPHHKNFNKRVVKMPKLYFYDTGLLCSLLGIQNNEQILYHPLAGSIFENMVVTELMKYRFNNLLTPHLYFWRDNTGHELDVLIDHGTGLYPIEIKSGKTITPEYFKGLQYWHKISGTSGGTVIFAGDVQQRRSNGITIFPWNKTADIWQNVLK